MKKIIAVIMFLVLMLPLASAIMPAPDNRVIGANQYYSVVFDGEGEAAVALKLELQNIDEGNLSEIRIEIPGEQIRIINIVQEYNDVEKRCVDWEEVCTDYNDDEDKCEEYTRKCRRWYEEKIYPPKYYAVEYETERLSKSVVYSIALKKEVKTQESATLLLYYKCGDYAKKSLGAFEFDFETIKLQHDSNNIRVAVDVTPELVLKGGEAEVDYRKNLFGAAEAMAAPMDEGVRSESLQQFSNMITWASGYVKTTSGLDPGESFHVKGDYAKSWLGLHWIGVISTVVVVALIILGLALLYVKKIRKMRKGKNAVTYAGLGVASSGIILALGFIARFLVQMAEQTVDWQTRSLVTILVYLITGLMMMVVFFGPAVYIGAKKGLMAGVWTIASTVCCLFIMVIIVVVLLILFKAGNASPVYRGVMEASADMAVESAG
ncbi:MAG: hypothetical protein ABIB71_05450 [Candidatus Woesearchaeota archaeon]